MLLGSRGEITFLGRGAVGSLPGIERVDTGGAGPVGVSLVYHLYQGHCTLHWTLETTYQRPETKHQTPDTRPDSTKLLEPARGSSFCAELSRLVSARRQIKNPRLARARLGKKGKIQARLGLGSKLMIWARYTLVKFVPTYNNKLLHKVL